MARDATARLYDVDEDSVVFKKLNLSEKYDHGTITFRARDGGLIDLEKLHESIWATRLSGRTSSGLVSLDVTAVGRLVKSQDGVSLRVSGSEAEFELAIHPDEDHASAFSKLQGMDADAVVEVTGRIADYQGRWPGVLRQAPPNPRCILVMDVEPFLASSQRD